MLSGIKAELINDVQQVGPAQNLLRDALHALLQVVINIRGNVILGHRRLLDQNQRGRLVARRQHPARGPHNRPTDE